MKFLIQVFVAIAFFISGYHCNLCGPDGETLVVPNVDTIFKSPQTYTIQPNNLVVVFNQYKSTFDGVKKILNAIKLDDNARRILMLFKASTIQFDIWTEDISKLDESNRNYVSKIYQTYKNFMRDYKEKIELFDHNQMSELGKNLREDEIAATNQLNYIDKVANKIHEEMAKRKTQMEQIGVHIKHGKPSAPALHQILNEIKSKFSFVSGTMLDIEQNIAQLQIKRNNLRKIEKNLKLNISLYYLLSGIMRRTKAELEHL
ncbi:uncharacterized protein LOC116341069 [Contarinia nasturtii]|uniref:uncharacterized protein LOC116341069 n=1 Tax=Contarinia nasturtii TaxID=265458 RepID=UPI0012D3E480|nr:uncharacterized protein LOC116341069 [Contarinia nasturtii]